jgi:hypothetical protein
MTLGARRKILRQELEPRPITERNVAKLETEGTVRLYCDGIWKPASLMTHNSYLVSHRKSDT